MATNKNEINDLTLVPIWNISIGDVGYTFHNGSGTIRRTWSLPNTMREIELKELKSAINESGVRQLFEVYNKEFGRYEDSELLIKNEEIRKILDLQPRGKYTLEKDQIIELFNNSTLPQFEEVLENCPNATLDKIVHEAIELPLNDINKINLIKSYSGKDVLTAIQNNTQSQSKVETTRKSTIETQMNSTGTRLKKS